MDWSKGYSALYYATIVDPDTWRDINRLEIISGSIKQQESGLRVSADLTCRNFDKTKELWVRIYLDANQNGVLAHEALFTGLATSPDETYDGVIETSPVACYSVLKPAEDVLLPRGWYAPKETQGGTVIKELFKQLPSPVVIDEGSPRLTSSIIAEDEENKLTMADKILKAIGWRMRIEGDGTIHITEKAKEAEVQFNAADNDSIEPDISKSSDWYSCPNVFRASTETATATAIDNGEGILSIKSRGREVWASEDGVELNANENLAQYATRRLKEEQSVKMPVSYKRRYTPGLVPTDLVRLHYPEQGLEGLYRITDSSIELGGKVTETAVKA